MCCQCFDVAVISISADQNTMLQSYVNIVIEKKPGFPRPGSSLHAEQATAMTALFTFSSPPFENHEWENGCELGDWQYPL